jgi:hypothetical protein
LDAGPAQIESDSPVTGKVSREDPEGNFIPFTVAIHELRAFLSTKAL